jgi:environmental stress-induced protein Ves
MRVLRAESHRRMPWKNGGGVTTEIAVFPEGAGLDDFAWRLSMASVTSDGPFSLFGGVDRTLAVLQGEGIVLSVDGMPNVELTRASQPFAFPADVSASARLVGGPIIDFNVMTRRGRFAHRVERLSGAQSSSACRKVMLTIILCAGGTAAVVSDGVQMALGRYDAAISESGFDEIVANTEAELYLVALDAKAGLRPEL